MQKKILSVVLSLFLVGSASSAFAGGYWTPSLDVDVEDSFNQDNDGFDVDIDDSFNKKYDVDIDDSFNTTNKTKVDVVAQGNLVGGHIVIQQFGGSAGSGVGGDMITVDNSINNSDINTHNINDSYNKTRTSTRTSTRNLNIDVDIDDSFNVDDSFNRAGRRHGHR